MSKPKDISKEARSLADDWADRMISEPELEIDPEAKAKDRKIAEEAHAASAKELPAQRVAAATEIAPRFQVALDKEAAGDRCDYLVTGPDYGCTNRYVGEFKPGRQSREIELSARAVRDLKKSTFTLKLLPAPAPKRSAPPE